jgi:hypothetical protein
MSEYWIREDGQVDFADGDIGDYNHEGIVIADVQRSIVDKCEQLFDVTRKTYYGERSFSDDEHIDWDEFEKALASAYAEEYVRSFPGQKKKVQRILEEKPEDLIARAYKRAGIKDEELAVAEGRSDARNYAMKYWGWKTYRNKSIDTWFFRRSDLKAIISGVEEIAHQDGWSKKLSKTTFSINVFSNKKHFYLSYNQMKNPKSSHQQQLPQFDYLSNQAGKQVKDIEYQNLHPFYKGRGGAFGGGGVVNPFGDCVMSFKGFLLNEGYI